MTSDAFIGKIRTIIKKQETWSVYMRSKLNEAKRIVIKIGTSSLMYPNGEINLSGIDELAFVLSDLRNQEKEVILVSSGAVGVGMNHLNLATRPTTIPKQQAVAAVGQAALMNIYNQRFANYGKQTAQLLLTRDIVEYPTSRDNVINTLEQLLDMGLIPIINENDTVAVDELDHQTKFGDNDQLSAIVSELIDADLLIMLSDIDGFYTNNPVTDPKATLYSHIANITDDLLIQATGKGSDYGTGGMTSKLKAAKRVLKNHSTMVLANGQRPKIIFDILAGKKIGTLFKEES